MLVFTEPIASGCVRRAPRAERGGEGLHLDRVAERGAGAVGLDVADVAGRDAGVGERGAHHRLLGGAVRGGEAAAGPVLVDRRAADHGEDAVAVGLRVAQALQHDDAAALAAHEAVGRRVERLAAAVGRQHVQLGQRDRCSPGDRIRLTPPASARSALAGAQALHGEVHGDERRASTPCRA